MSRYIDADAFEQAMYEEAFEKDSDMQRWDSGFWIRYKLYENVLDAQPTIDAVPVKHGKWTHYKDEHTCSKCGETVTGGWDEDYDYCPNCGARMDKE